MIAAVVFAKVSTLVVSWQRKNLSDDVVKRSILIGKKMQNYDCRVLLQLDDGGASIITL